MEGMIAPGTYPATVTGSALGLTGTGKEQIAIGLDVHVTDRSTGEMYPVPMTWYGYVHSDAALRVTDKALAALGFDPTTRDLSELGPEEPHASPIVGATCEVVVEHEHDEEYGTRARVKWLNRPGGGGVAVKERMDPKQARAFGAAVRGRLLAARGPGAASAPPQRPAAPAPRGGAPAGPQRPAAPAGGRPAVPPRQPAPPRGSGPSTGSNGDPRFDQSTIDRAREAGIGNDDGFDIPF